MAQEEYRPPVKEFLDMLADLLAKKYFERMDDRLKKIPELRRLITAKEASQYLSLFDRYGLPDGLPEKTPLPQNWGPGSFRCKSPRPLD